MTYLRIQRTRYFGTNYSSQKMYSKLHNILAKYHEKIKNLKDPPLCYIILRISIIQLLKLHGVLDRQFRYISLHFMVSYVSSNSK